MFIWLRRVFSEFVSITYWKTSLSPTRRQAASVSSCQFPRFYGDIFVHPIKRKTTLSSVLHWFCLAIVGIYLLSFSGGTMAVNPKGDLLAISAAAVWALYSILMKEIGKFGFPTIFVTRKNFRIRNPLYAPSTIIRVMSELAKDF